MFFLKNPEKVVLKVDGNYSILIFSMRVLKMF